MEITKAYENFKKIKNGQLLDLEEANLSLCILIDILTDWVAEYNYSTEMDMLIKSISNDYKCHTSLYRGITLLKKDKHNFIDKIDIKQVQSFTKNKSIALNFANNGKVTIDEDINIDFPQEDTLPILMVYNGMGIDLVTFCKDINAIYQNYITDEDKLSYLQEIFEFVIPEEEVLVFSNNLNKQNLFIKIV